MRDESADGVVRTLVITPEVPTAHDPWAWMNRLSTLNGSADTAERKPIEKGKSTLQRSTENERDEKALETVWQAAVWLRDKDHCRKCKRKCVKGGKRIEARGEVHHVEGRAIQAIRWLRKNGALLCAGCHEQVTGRVNERWIIVATKTYIVLVKGVATTFRNADKTLRFEKVA